MELSDYKRGKLVKVVSDNGTRGMTIDKKHLTIREIGQTGKITGLVPGHGGDVWWVEQDNGVAAYCFNELEGDE